jgi:hypothetical protein
MTLRPFPQDDHDGLDQEIHDRDVQADRAAALDEMAAGVIAALDEERAAEAIAFERQLAQLEHELHRAHRTGES